MIFFGERSLQTAVHSYVEDYHKERNHQGLNNSFVEPSEDVGQQDGEIECCERLGGLLRYNYRNAT